MFDLVFFVIVGVSTALAALRGGLRELSTILAMGIAAGLAYLITGPLLNALGLSGRLIPTVIFALGIAGLFFAASHIAFHLGLQRLPIQSRGKIIDRVSGGVFGALRGLILIGLGYLGYSYYLDEAAQPDAVKNALTQPIAASVANFFEGFAPESAYIENTGPDADATENDPAVTGYGRDDRNGLLEVVTTVTTTDPTLPGSQAGAGAQPDDDAESVAESDELNLDAIADILEDEDNQ